LPGNHDPAVPEVVSRPGIAEAPNDHLLGVSVDGAVCFDDFDLEISGVAHMTYADTPRAGALLRLLRTRAHDQDRPPLSSGHRSAPPLAGA